MTTTTTSTAAFSWTASTDNIRVSGYDIFRNGTDIATTSATSFTDTNLGASTTYTYALDAFDEVNNTSTQSSSTQATTKPLPDTTPPSTPTGLSATAVSTSEIDLSWTPSTDNVGVAGYQVFRDGFKSQPILLPRMPIPTSPRARSIVIISMPSTRPEIFPKPPWRLRQPPSQTRATTAVVSSV